MRDGCEEHCVRPDLAFHERCIPNHVVGDIFCARHATLRTSASEARSFMESSFSGFGPVPPGPKMPARLWPIGRVNIYCNIHTLLMTNKKLIIQRFLRTVSSFIATPVQLTCLIGSARYPGRYKHPRISVLVSCIILTSLIVKLIIKMSYKTAKTTLACTKES